MLKVFISQNAAFKTGPLQTVQKKKHRTYLDESGHAMMRHAF